MHVTGAIPAVIVKSVAPRGRRRTPGTIGSGYGRRPLARRSAFATVALLAAMLLLPLAGGAAPPAQETPDDATTDTALLAPEDQSGIFVNIFGCPSGAGGDLNTLLQTCAVDYSIEFEIYGPNLTQFTTGGIAFERLPAGYYRVHAFIPAGYGNPTAFCGVGPTYDQLPPFVPVVVYDGYYEFELGPGQALFCDWFLIPPTPVTYNASILINKHFCPPAAYFDAYAATIYDLAANCQEPAFPVTFTVLKDGSAIASGDAAGAPNYLALTGLPTGPVSVVETLPEGYGDPLVFCSVSDELGNDRAPLTQATVDNDRIYWTLNDGDVVFCDWFNVPAPRGVTITVVKYVCPSRVKKDLVVYEAYAAVCTTTASNVAFKLDGASTGNPGEQLTDANGQVTWAEMEADHYYLTEEVPAGFGRPAAFCTYYDPAAFQVFEYERYPVSAENRIEFDLADGEHLLCTWFNVTAR
jgi:hypothetical protein